MFCWYMLSVGPSRAKSVGSLRFNAFFDFITKELSAGIHGFMTDTKINQSASYGEILMEHDTTWYKVNERPKR